MVLGALFAASMACWEWRYFLQRPLPAGPLPLAGKREDIYFPTGESLGLKLRNGAGALEAKRRLRRSKEGVELWVKTLHEGCTAASSHGPRLELDAAKELELAPEEVETLGSAELPMLVRCRKSRRITDFGEEVDCVFIAETGLSVVLAERYRSISVESPRLEDIGPIVQQLGPVPEGAIVAGYPAIIQAVADRARAALRGGREAQSSPTAPETGPGNAGDA